MHNWNYKIRFSYNIILRIEYIFESCKSFIISHLRNQQMSLITSLSKIEEALKLLGWYYITSNKLDMKPWVLVFVSYTKYTAAGPWFFHLFKFLFLWLFLLIIIKHSMFGDNVTYRIFYWEIFLKNKSIIKDLEYKMQITVVLK